MRSDYTLPYLFIRSGIAGREMGAALGIEALQIEDRRRGQKLLSTDPVLDLRVPLPYDETLHPRARQIEHLLGVHHTIAQGVKSVALEGIAPVILTGDHSSAGAIIAGLRMAFPSQRLGVVWVDAHGDIHTPYTSPTGNVHGMPLGVSLGLTSQELAEYPVPPATHQAWLDLVNLGGIAPKILPQDLVYLGIRSVEPAEWAVIENNNILYYEPDEICQMGTDAVIAETVQHLSHCDWVFISFDVDVLDAAMVPGTGTPEPDGLSGLQAKELVTGLLKRVKLAAFECTELNPLRDQDGRTTRLVYDLLADMLPLAREAQRVMR